MPHMNPMLQADAYKMSHKDQYPEGTTLVFSNWTPRSSKYMNGVETAVHFGLQYFCQEYLINQWQEHFFNQPKEMVVKEYEDMLNHMGIKPADTSHVGDLHDLGFLPLAIMAVPEGTSVKIGTPMLVMWNTLPEFFWVTNFVETAISQSLWGPCTAATIAKEYRRVLDFYIGETGGDLNFVPFQGHDFSMRGMYGLEASMLSGAGHLTSFTGTDTIPAIHFLNKYYDGESSDFVAGSVPATEHSVSSAHGHENEADMFRKFITETYPSGIVSIVSDTWDYWKVLTEIVPSLKNEILDRDGVVTLRPDSGDPVKIIVGDDKAEPGTPEFKGSFELLWETFGGTLTDEGYKMLDGHINLIYGDSITLDRCEAICSGLMDKGFVPKMIFGIGSYTYQYMTRDTLGFAIKATYCEIDGESRNIFKDPVTDDGVKKSAKGLLAVVDGELVQEASWDQVLDCDFNEVFRDGRIIRKETLDDVRSLTQA